MVSVTMRVFMVVIVVMCVAVGMAMGVGMTVPAGVIGPALWLKTARDFLHRCAQPDQHIGDHVVIADIEAIGLNLCRQVAVTQMPGNPHQRMGIVTGDLQQGFRCGGNQDQSAIPFEPQGVARNQCLNPWQVEEEGKPALRRHGKAAAMPVIKIQPYGVPHRALPGAGLFNANGPWLHLTLPLWLALEQPSLSRNRLSEDKLL